MHGTLVRRPLQSGPRDDIGTLRELVLRQLQRPPRESRSESGPGKFQEPSESSATFTFQSPVDLSDVAGIACYGGHRTTPFLGRRPRRSTAAASAHNGQRTSLLPDVGTAMDGPSAEDPPRRGHDTVRHAAQNRRNDDGLVVTTKHWTLTKRTTNGRCGTTAGDDADAMQAVGSFAPSPGAHGTEKLPVTVHDIPEARSQGQRAAEDEMGYRREYPCTVDLFPDGLQYPLLLNVAVCRAREVMMRDGALVVRGPLLSGPEMTLAPRHKEYLKCTRHIDVKLMNREEWHALAAIPHEMIVNGVGRKIRPPLTLKVAGLEKASTYSLALIFVPLGVRYLKCGNDNGVWAETDDVVDTDRFAPEYVHSLGVTSGAAWMARRINFEGVRLTASPCRSSAQVPLERRRMYQPVLQFRCKRHSTAVNVVLPELRFIAVCSYQNPKMKRLKARYGRNFGLNAASVSVAHVTDARLARKRKCPSDPMLSSSLCCRHVFDGTPRGGYCEDGIVDDPGFVPADDAEANFVVAPCSSRCPLIAERHPVPKKKPKLPSPEEEASATSNAEAAASLSADIFPTVDDFFEQLSSKVPLEDLDAILDDDLLSSVEFPISETAEIGVDGSPMSAHARDVADDGSLRSRLQSHAADYTLSTLRYVEKLLPDDLLFDAANGCITDDRLRTPVRADEHRFGFEPVADGRGFGFRSAADDRGLGFQHIADGVSDSLRTAVGSRNFSAIHSIPYPSYSSDDNQIPLEAFQLTSCYTAEDSWFG